MLEIYLLSFIVLFYKSISYSYCNQRNVIYLENSQVQLHFNIRSNCLKSWLSCTFVYIIPFKNYFYLKLWKLIFQISEQPQTLRRNTESDVIARNLCSAVNINSLQEHDSTGGFVRITTNTAGSRSEAIEQCDSQCRKLYKYSSLNSSAMKCNIWTQFWYRNNLTILLLLRARNSC